MRTTLASLLLAAALASTAFAQTAQLSGRVTDASGAVVPATKITVRNISTTAERTVETNDLGLYSIPLLPTGTYQVHVVHQGFKPILRDGIILEVDQRATADFSLQIGAVTDQIEVSAAISQLNTVEASQGQVIDNQRIVDMPLNGRNYLDLALMSGGAVQADPGSRLAGFSSGGQRVSQNNYIMDGIDNNSVELAAAGRRAEMVEPSIDAIQEFKVQTNSYAAEFGRGMGAVVNLTIKSGTNAVHGTAFEFVRNEVFDAKNFFNPPTANKPPFKRNQYGLSLGGPVVIPHVYNGRNKTFFFGDFERTRIRQTSTISSTLPTAKMRNGDFSELSKKITDPTTGQQFPGNVIPLSRFDPVAANLIKLYPAVQTSNLAANFTNLSPQNQDVDKYDVRIDHSAGSKDNFFFRYSSHDTFLPDTPNLPAPAYGAGNLDYITEGINTGAGWNHIFTPNLIFSVRAGWNFARFKRNNPASALGHNFNKEYNIPGASLVPDGSFSQLSITGYRALGIGPNNPVDRNSQNRQISGDLSWTHDRHTIKTGASFIRSQNPIFNIRNTIGTFTFNGAYTGDGEADFLLGMVNQWAWQSPVIVSMRTFNFGGYVQDDIKVNNRLTVNLGLRYEISPPWYEKYNKMGNFDIDTTPGTPALVLAANGSLASRATVATDTDNIMPRVGLAFKLNNKTVIRSGYGLFYQYMENLGDAEYLIGNAPYAYGVTITGSTTTPVFKFATGPAAGATDLTKATGLQFTSYERNAKQGGAHQWNFNIQRELGANWLLEVGYSGSRGLHLLRRYDGNFSPAGPGNVDAKRIYKSIVIPGTNIVSSPLGPIYSYRADGNSNYQALITKIEKRFSKGLTVLGSYTWSKSIGDTCGSSVQGDATGCGYQNIFNLRPERAVDNQDVPHRFVTSALYDLPFGKSRAYMANAPRAVEGVLGGWSIGSIVSEASQVPFSPTVSGNTANTGTYTVVVRPDVVGSPYNNFDRTLAQDFNTSAFAKPANFTYGSSGRNVLRGRPQFNWDFSALKNFQLVERVRLQFRFEAFTLTNTPRFGAPGNVLGTAAFGVISSAGTPRNLQFGLKLLW